MKRFLKTVLLLLLALSVLSCHDEVFPVKSFGKPEYPTLGVIRGIEGTVQVSVSIEADGTVSSALGAGADPILVEAAERNARQWVFGPLPRKMTYPANHQIEYVYKFRGHPLFIVTPPTITTDLPDRIEIVSSPFVSDNLARPVKPPKSEKNWSSLGDIFSAFRVPSAPKSLSEFDRGALNSRFVPDFLVREAIIANRCADQNLSQ